MAKIEIKRGDIVEVDLDGAVGVEKQNDRMSKARPCVVVQNDVGNKVSPMTLVAPLTDMDQFKDLPVQVAVKAAELHKGGKDSVIECGHIRSIDRDKRIKRHLGSVAPAVLPRLNAALKSMFGL